MHTKRKRNLSLSLTAGLLCLGAAGAQSIYNPDLNNRTVAGQWTIIGPDTALGDLDRNPTLNLGADGSISGFAGCNTFMGTYAARGSAFLTLPLGLTRMMCTPAAMQTEQNVMKRLQTAYKVQLEGAIMHLHSKNGDLLLRRSGPALGLQARDHQAQGQAQGKKRSTMPSKEMHSKEVHSKEVLGQYRASTFILGGKSIDASGIHLTFNGLDHPTPISVTAGCNNLGFGIEAVSGKEVLVPMSSTLAMCAPETMQKEQALNALLTGAEIVHHSGAVTLKSERGTLTLTPMADANTGTDTGTGTGTDTGTDTHTGINSAALMGTYQLVSVEKNGQALSLAGYLKPVTLTLAQAGDMLRLSGMDGCNSFAGAGVLEGRRLRASDLMGTLVFCDSLVNLPDLGKQLLSGAEVHQRGDTIVLAGKQGGADLTWTFKRQ